MQTSIKFRFIQTNGIRLRVAIAGPETGDPVILLHGFPEAWFGWESQIVALAAAGFRVIAPDQRGYNVSDKPKGVAAYRIDHLAADIIGIADALGYERFCLAGHDWGASVAWWTAQEYPERVKKLAILNAPHGEVMLRQLRKDRKQRRKSWYMFFFQLPVLPELLLKLGNFQAMTSQLPRLPQAEYDRYRAAWGQPGAMTGMLNWYRAAFQTRPKVTKPGRIKPPTLVIWGKQDRYLSYEMAQASVEKCEDGRLVTIDHATHWVQHDAAERMNALLIEHFYE